MKRARDIITDLFTAANAPVADAADWAPSLWPLAAGETLARSTYAAELRNGILYVEVAGPEWVAELENFEGQLRAAFNQRAGRQLVRRIVFRPGRALRKPPQRAQSAAGVENPLRRAAGRD